MRHALLALGLVLLPAPASAQTAPAQTAPAQTALAETPHVPLEDAAAGLALFPCELSGLSCTTLTVPLDHRANDPTETLEITFALSFASVESRGILFYYVGGPGGSGLASADSYLSAYDSSLTDYMDVVFVDQRGIGATHGLACPVAQARFDTASVSLDDPDAVLNTARTYVADCTAELDADRLLQVVDTDQAIRDFELFRQAIGAPKVWLYGESYGTQVAQAYATAFPQAVKGVILDGVVDLTLDAEGFYRRYTLAAERLLAETFALCTDLVACKADMQGDPAQVHDALAARLAKAPLPVPFTLSDGSSSERVLTAGLFDASAFYALYSPEGRAEYLRALAAAGRGDLGPMLRLGYANMYIDPETEIGQEDPGWYGAAYYAITCADYASGPGTPDENAARILDEARALASDAPRLIRSYYLERIACAYWPKQGPDARPAPYAGGDWPTLVLNGDRDPITPVSMAYDVLDNARNAYGVVMQGGPHVIWGRGFACPDAIVQALLFEGTIPAAREQLCQQDVIAPYVPLTLTSPEQWSDPFTLARALETELSLFTPIASWDGVQPASFGCPFGGRVTVSLSASTTDYGLADCRFWPDISVTGSGEETDSSLPEGGLRLVLAVSGAQTGQIDYRYSAATESYSLTGTWNGTPAALPRKP